MAQKVVWSKRATDDLYEIHKILSQRSETHAEAVIDALVDGAFRLEQFPRLGRVVPELNIETLRELLIRQYRVVYALSINEGIEILTIRHSSRPLADVR